MKTTEITPELRRKIISEAASKAGKANSKAHMKRISKLAAAARARNKKKRDKEAAKTK